MATSSLLHSTSSALYGQRATARYPTLRGGSHLKTAPPPVVVVRAAGVAVSVDKTESEKTHRLKSAYLERVIPVLKDEFSYANIHQVPKIEKIVVNCGIGEAAQNTKGLDAAINDLAKITGQRPVKTRAKKAIASFKIRENQELGIAVTLRGNMMYAFLDRLINLALPRTRDFQGVNPNSFDGHGNYSIGFREQSVFPEIKQELVGKARGMDVCITTTAHTDKEAHKLLSLLGMPFREGAVQSSIVRKKKLKSHHFDSKSRGRR